MCIDTDWTALGVIARDGWSRQTLMLQRISNIHNIIKVVPLHLILSRLDRFFLVLGIREIAKVVLELVNRRGHQACQQFQVIARRCTGVASCGYDLLCAFETCGQCFTLLAGKQAFKTRHIFLLFMFDVVVKKIHQSIKEGHEFRIHRRHILQLVKVILDLIPHSSASSKYWLIDDSLTYTLMLFLISLGQTDTFFAQMLLHGGIPCQFLADGVAGDCPGQLVSPADFCCVVGGVLEVFVEDVEFVVVGTDGFGDRLAHDCDGCVLMS